MANKADQSGAKTINVLTETIAREKASLHARIERLRNENDIESDIESSRRPGRLYEVFQAIYD